MKPTIASERVERGVQEDVLARDRERGSEKGSVKEGERKHLQLEKCTKAPANSSKYFNGVAKERRLHCGSSAN